MTLRLRRNFTSNIIFCLKTTFGLCFYRLHRFFSCRLHGHTCRMKFAREMLLVVGFIIFSFKLPESLTFSRQCQWTFSLALTGDGLKLADVRQNKIHIE